MDIIKKRRLLIVLLCIIALIGLYMYSDMKRKERESAINDIEQQEYLNKFSQPQIDFSTNPQETSDNESGTSIIIKKSDVIINKTNFDYMLAIQDKLMSALGYFENIKKIHELDEFYKKNKNELKETLGVDSIEGFKILADKVRKVDKLTLEIDDNSVHVDNNIIMFTCIIDEIEFNVKTIVNVLDGSYNAILYLS